MFEDQNNKTNWDWHVDNHFGSGETVTEYCAKHGLSKAGMYAARSRLGKVRSKKVRAPAFVDVSRESEVRLRFDGQLVDVMGLDRDRLSAVLDAL